MARKSFLPALLEGKLNVGGIMHYMSYLDFPFRKMIASLLVSTSLLLGNVAIFTSTTQVAWGQIIPDADTVILDHFNGATVGTAFGQLSFETSQPTLGEAGRFGSDIYVKYGFSNWYSITGTQGTIEMWVKPDQPGGLLNFNWSNTTAYPSSGHVLHFIIDSSLENILTFNVWPPSGSLQSPLPIPLGEWTHLAVSWGPTVSKLYIDGELVASVNANVAPSLSSTTYAYLNYWGGNVGGSTFTGLIDELHISKVQRTDEEIRTHATPPVICSCHGFFPPADENFSIKKRNNQVVPFAMEVLCPAGFVPTPPILEVDYSSGTGGGVYEEEALFAGLGDEGNQFVLRDGKWHFNYKFTKSTATGEYTFSAVTDGTYELNPTCSVNIQVE